MTILMSYQVADLIETIFLAGGICIALPITLVAMITRARTKKMDRKMDILARAVENGLQVDPALLVTAEEEDGKYKLKKSLLNRLMWGTIFTFAGALFLGFTIWYDDSGPVLCIAIALLAIGIGCLVSYFVGRKMLAPEIRAEEEKISK